MDGWWFLLTPFDPNLRVNVLDVFGDFLKADVVSTVLSLQDDAENLALCVGNSRAYQSFSLVCGFVED